MFFFQIYIYSDAAYICSMAAFALSEGYLTNICLMFGPKTAEKPSEQDQTAAFILMALSTSFTLGFILSSPLIKLL